MCTREAKLATSVHSYGSLSVYNWETLGHICSFPSISRFGHCQCTCTLLCTAADNSNLCMTTFLAVDDNYYSNKIKALKII